LISKWHHARRYVLFWTAGAPPTAAPLACNEITNKHPCHPSALVLQAVPFVAKGGTLQASQQTSPL
jgi:hypothetical protein